MDCAIIRDLLPLYHDGVCSPASRAAVEKHLETCEDCRRALAEAATTLPEMAAPEPREGEMLRKLSRSWEGDKRRSWLKGAILAAAVCVLIFGGYLAITQGYWFSVDTETIRITDTRQLSDGRILFHLCVDDDLALREIRFEFDEEGNMYWIPKRALITEKRMMAGSAADRDYDLNLPVLNGYAGDHGYPMEVQRVWCGRGADAILIWERDMELPAASAEDETRWGYDCDSASYWAGIRGE